jgi:hypothetical protein
MPADLCRHRLGMLRALLARLMVLPLPAIVIAERIIGRPIGTPGTEGEVSTLSNVVYCSQRLCAASRQDDCVRTTPRPAESSRRSIIVRGYDCSCEYASPTDIDRSCQRWR